jgi:hypothetical protein
MQTSSTEQRLYRALRQLRRLAETAAVLQRRVSSAEESIDALVREIASLVVEIAAVLGTDPGTEGGSRAVRRRTTTCRQGRTPDSDAVRVASVDMVMGERGPSRVAINGEKTMNLSETLAGYLCILASDEAPASGPIVGWKPKRQVAERMESLFGRTFVPHTLDNLTSRLRVALEEVGEPRTLMQADRRLGMRFAVQRGGLSVSERPEP